MNPVPLVTKKGLVIFSLVLAYARDPHTGGLFSKKNIKFNQTNVKDNAQINIYCGGRELRRI